MRRMTEAESALAEDAMQFVPKALAALACSFPGIHRQIQKIDAESVAYLAICRAAQTYNPEKSQPTTYFSRAIRNAVLKEIAKRRRQALDGPQRVTLLEADLQDYDPSWRLPARALMSMPEDLARILKCRFYSQMNLSEIAEQERCARSTVRRRLSKALLLFRAALEIQRQLP
jgi:RNA polymerase sigma factor (sigma-70 family)